MYAFKKAVIAILALVVAGILVVSRAQSQSKGKVPIVMSAGTNR